MPRGAKCRFVGFYPPYVEFRPEYSGFDHRETVIVKIEEFEAIRLKDHLKQDQEECARRMHVSRPTFQRILGEARSKLADALLNGKAIRIEGGNFCIGSGYCWRQGRCLEIQDECSLRAVMKELEEISAEEVKALKDTIAVCAAGERPDSQLDGRFGRCPYVAIWNREKGFQQAINNQNIDMGHGAGTGTAQIILSQQVGVVLTSKIGPKAFAVLNRAGVEVYAVRDNMTVSEAVQQYETGALHKLETANN